MMMRRIVMASATLLGLSLTACGSSSKDDSASCGTAPACTVPWDCAVGFTCDTGCCVEFGCTPSSCDNGKFCDPDTRSCMSVAEKCEFSIEGCECQIVNSVGEFAATGAPTITLAGGASMPIKVSLSASGGLPLPGATFTYEVGDETRFAVSAAGLLSAQSSGSAGDDVLTAHAGTFATCTANLKHLGAAPADGRVRVFIFDDQTGNPIAGAVVLIDHGAGDGVPDETLSTDANGLATTANPIPATGVYSVSVFATSYSYLSIVALNANTAPDLALPLAARKLVKTTAGFSGKPDYASYERQVLGGPPKAFKFAITSGSFLLKTLLNFDLDLFVGPIADVSCATVDSSGKHPAGCYDLSESGLPGTDDLWAPLPGGVILTLANNAIKDYFDVVVQPGRRYAWTIGGEVELSDLSGLISSLSNYLSCDCDVTTDVCDASCTCDSDCGVNVDFGQVFNSVLPLFSRFASGVKGNVVAKEVAYSDWEDFIAEPYGNRSDSAHNFEVLDDSTNLGKLEITEPLQAYTELAMSPLPADPVGDYSMEGVVVMTGVNAAGYGFVPLGLAAGLDCTTTHCLDRANYPNDFDGTINPSLACLYDPAPDFNGCPPGVPTGELTAGHVPLFHARAHGGLEDQEWITIALAFPISALADSVQDGVVRATANVVREEPTPGAGLLTGGIPASNQLNKAYPGFPTQPATLNGRSYTAAPVADAQIHWVTVASEVVTGTGTQWDGSTTRWNIYYASAGATFTAPSVPASVVGENPKPDPFVPTSRGVVNVTHVGFRAPNTTLEELAKNNGSTLSSLLDRIDGFAVLNRDIPAVD